jgi:hypothetical protein
MIGFNMENTHYITAAEADDRLCPMAKQQQNAEWEYYCDGPKCMAWRWQQTVIRENNSVKMTPEGLVRTISTTHGYCGMVRT